MHIKKLVPIAAASLIAAAGIATPAEAAKYEPGDNPMCAKFGDRSGKKLYCLEASSDTPFANQSIYLTSKRTIFEPGQTVCAARSDGGPGGDYELINACVKLPQNGQFRLRLIVGRTGKQWIDIGKKSCLKKPPNKRSQKKCGDNGGVQSTPLKIVAR